MAQPATLNDVVGKLDEIRAKVALIEQRQEHAAKREDEIDERLKAVEKVERAIPWKMIAAVAALGGVLLVPSIGTLVMLGRRDAQLEALAERVERIDATTTAISEDVGSLAESRAASEARREDDRRRIDALERAAHLAP